MKLLRLALLAFPLLSGCFVNVKIPLDTDLDRTELGTRSASRQPERAGLLLGRPPAHAGRREAGQDRPSSRTRIRSSSSILFGIYARDHDRQGLRRASRRSSARAPVRSCMRG
jgi:hypothetical protein